MSRTVEVTKRADLPRALTWEEQDANMQALADGVAAVSQDTDKAASRSATSTKHATADYALSPGDTDHTADLVAALTALGGAGFRGLLELPAGLAYDWDAVTSAVGVGTVLKFFSSKNWGQPPGYQNKFIGFYSGDVAADDFGFVLGSRHHPAIFLLNDGKAGTTSANERLASILYAVGMDYAGDPLLGMMMQFRDDSGRFALTMRAQVPRDIAFANPQLHTPGHTYAAGDYCIGAGGKVYQTAAGGVAGLTAPSHTSGSVTDGAVLWAYVQGALSIDATRFGLYDDGELSLYGPGTKLLMTGKGADASPVIKPTPTNGSSVEVPAPFLKWVAGSGISLVKSDGSGAFGTLLDDGVQFDMIGQQVAPPSVASASTIAPTKRITVVSGTGTINTITPPPGIAATGGELILIASGAWNVTAAGNVSVAFTAAVGRHYRLVWDAGTSKFYPAG